MEHTCTRHSPHFLRKIQGIKDGNSTREFLWEGAIEKGQKLGENGRDQEKMEQNSQ